MNNKIDLKILQETITDLKNNPNACTTFEGAKEINDTFAILESYPGEQLSKFIQYFYENDLIDQDYIENYEKIKDKKIEEFTYDEVLTGLTKIIREDRFNSGEIYTCVKNGSMLKLIERLYELSLK